MVAVSALLLPFGNYKTQAQVVCDARGDNCIDQATGQQVDVTSGNTLQSGTPASGALTAQNNDNSWSSWLDPIKWATSLINLIGYFLLRIGALILSLVGLIFNMVLDYTVVHMADQVNNAKGLGGGIDTAWATLRDIANMVFIFVLLWAAIQTILELNTSKFTSTIRNIIIIALLINFSLFFSKVVIDAANIATIGFYNSILAGAGQPITLAGFPIGDFAGIFMKATGVQSFYGSQLLTSLQQSSSADITQFLTGLLGMVTMLVMAMVLLVAAVMFVARYILLVFIMILSPIAFVGYILPAMRSVWSKWLSALINQSFFAPVFMILIWVALRIISALSINTQGHEFSTVATLTTDTVSLFMNFALVIGFIVAALIISKQMASRTMGFSAITAGAGAVIVGGSAKLGRSTAGRTGKILAENARLQEAANKERSGLWDRTKGAAARATLYTAKTARTATFDARNAAIPTSVVGDVIEGTVGRTKYGKKFGLNDVNIGNIDIGRRIAGDTIGKPGTKGFTELKAESDKRVRDEEASAAAERNLVQARKAVKDGASAATGTPAYDAMEKALAKLSDKETEALVASNRELLKSQNFANAISVKQLEALNKSDQFSESEKSDIKNTRFKAINDAVAIGTSAAVAAVRSNIRGLTDSELEMINSGHLGNNEFVSHLKPSQIEAINKGNKFTSSDKAKLKTARMAPLTAALASGSVTDTENALKSLGPKEVASLDMAVLQDPTMMQAYSKQLLKRMAPEINPSDIPILRARILASLPSTHPAHVWLMSTDGTNNFS